MNETILLLLVIVFVLFYVLLPKFRKVFRAWIGR